MKIISNTIKKNPISSFGIFSFGIFSFEEVFKICLFFGKVRCFFFSRLTFAFYLIFYCLYFFICCLLYCDCKWNKSLCKFVKEMKNFSVIHPFDSLFLVFKNGKIHILILKIGIHTFSVHSSENEISHYNLNLCVTDIFQTLRKTGAKRNFGFNSLLEMTLFVHFFETSNY